MAVDLTMERGLNFTALFTVQQPVLDDDGIPVVPAQYEATPLLDEQGDPIFRVVWTVRDRPGGTVLLTVDSANVADAERIILEPAEVVGDVAVLLDAAETAAMVRSGVYDLVLVDPNDPTNVEPVVDKGFLLVEPRLVAVLT